MTAAQLDANLGQPELVRDSAGQLWVGGVDAAELLTQHGSPLLILLPERAYDNVLAMRRAFGRRFANVSVHYALKASYHRAHIEAALAAGAGLEVMSGLELQMAVESGCPADLLVCNGLGRDSAYLRDEAVLSGALHVLDSLTDIRNLSAAAELSGRDLRVALRVAPDIPTLSNLMPTDSKLGLSWTEGSFDEALELVLEAPRLHLVGLHAHGFTHARDPQEWGAFVRSVAEVAVSLEERLRHPLELIDIGGGFETRSVLEAEGTRIEHFANVAARALSIVDHPFKLVVEPGRYVASDAAVGLGHAVARKRRSNVTWDIIDLASNTLIPVPGADYPVVPVSAADQGERTLSGIGDGTCAPSILHPPQIAAPIRTGAPVAIRCCGAYTTVFAHVWGPLPPVTLAVERAAVTSVVGVTQLEQVVFNLYGRRVNLSAGRFHAADDT